MNEPRQVILEREAVPHEEHAGSSTVAACEPEVARGDGREWVADDPDLDEARVHGDAEQDSGGEDERCAAESSHDSLPRLATVLLPAPERVPAGWRPSPAV